jgi:lactate racemase
VSIFNHDGRDPHALTTLGVIPAAEIATISGGLLSRDVPAKLNRAILDYDYILICGPVFPHPLNTAAFP